MQVSKNKGETPKHVPGGWDDVLHDTFYGGGIGGSIVALLFLLIDALEGQPLFTPTLVASVLFLGIPAEQVQEVRLDMVAIYTVVHFAACGACAFVVALAIRRAERGSVHPVLLLLGAFLLLELGLFFGTTWLAPGVIERVGLGRITVVNLLASMGVAAFLLAEHRPSAPPWFQKLVRSLE